MESTQQDEVSLTTPFLVHYYTDKCNDLERGQAVEDNDLRIVGTTSFSKTVFNGLNAMSGVGILSIPYALSRGGWLSLILLSIVATATFYTGLLLKRCMDVDHNIRSYPDIGDKAFGPKGRLVVSVFMNLELYLVATGFLIMAGDNLNNMFPNMEINLYGILLGGQESFVLLSAIVIMPTVWINNMETLSYVSATGVFASILILSSVLWSGVFEGVGFHQKGELLNWSGLPTALSLYAFCYCAHPVFPTLYTSMTKQKHFSRVLFLCFLFCTVTYALMAILGYLMFGSELQSQITLNLATSNLSSKVAVSTTLITPIAKYALMLKPIVDAIESRLESGCAKKRCYKLLVRSMLLVSSVVVALTLPFFGVLMSLVGAFLSVTASILLPCLCYLKISGGFSQFGFESVIIIFTLLMGLIILVVGTYTSLLEVIQIL